MAQQERDQRLAAWVFGGVAFAVLIWIILFGPKELPPARHQAFGILCAILCGLFGYFFTGTMLLTTSGRLPKWGMVSIKAGGGAALFVFVLMWWNSGANPVREIKEDIKVVKDGIQNVETNLNDLKTAVDANTKLANAVLDAVRQQGKVANSRDSVARRLDFPAAFREVAEQFRTTPEDAEKVVRQWVAEKQSSSDLSERAKAEFLAKNFAKSADLSREASAEKLRRAEMLADERANLLKSAVEDLQRAGEALRADGKFSDAISLFEQALGHVSRTQSPQAWGSLQNWLGICHCELGRRVVEAEANRHFESALSAFRCALEALTREQFSHEWARTQSNVGVALRALARQSEWVEEVRLTDQAVSAYRAALEVLTREQFPQEWARAQNNLGAALSGQAWHERTDAVRFLGQAENACRAALEVYTREQFPQEWAVAQNNLGAALSRQAEWSKGAEAVRLLGQAVSAFRAALEVLTREKLPSWWAATHYSLGAALRDQAERSEGAASVRLMNQAVVAFRAALEVYTAELFPSRNEAVAIDLHRVETLLQEVRASEP